MIPGQASSCDSLLSPSFHYPLNDKQNIVLLGLPVFIAEMFLPLKALINTAMRPPTSVLFGGGDDLVGSWMDHYPGRLIPAAASRAGSAAALISRD